MIISRIYNQLFSALSDDPHNGVAWLLKSWAFKETKENDQSMEAGLRAIGLSPLTAAAFESIGTLRQACLTQLTTAAPTARNR